MLAENKNKAGFEEHDSVSRMSDAYETLCYEMLCMMIAEASAAFEKLPCLWDEDILRNILYAGVWSKFQKLQDKKSND